MPISDKTNVAFSTLDDIDQMVRSGSATVSVSDNNYATVYTFVTGDVTSGDIPVVIAYYTEGGSAWREFGNEFFIYTNTTNIRVRGGASIGRTATLTIRYYIINDKVNY